MDNLLDQLNNILINPPGNLIYHLTLAFCVFAALQTALITQRGRQNGRSLLGLNLILLSQLALFIAGGLSWQGVISSHLFLPLLDRAIIVFSILWIGWMWAFPERSERSERNSAVNIGMGLLNLGILVLLFFTYNQWSKEGSSLAFNNTWLDWTWCFAGVAMVVLSLVAVIVRRPDGWTIGVGMAILNLAGLLAHIFLSPPEEDYSSFIRLAQLAAFPLLPGLMARQSRSLSPFAKTDPSGGDAASAQTAARSPRVADPRSIHAWVDLNLQSEPARICTGVARAVAQSLLADVCYVVTAPNEGYSPVILQGGYDLLREDAVPGTILEQARVPTLAAALQKARGLRILASESKSPDLKSLSDALALKEVGNLLLIPLTSNGAPWGGLLLLSPYSNRLWTMEEMNSFAAESESITAVLSKAQKQADNRLEFERNKDTLGILTRESESLRQQNQQLLNDISQLRKVGAGSGNGSADMEALLAVQQETQETLTLIQNENMRLKALLARSAGPQGSDVTQMENELRTVLQEVARLQNQLIESNSRVLDLEHQTSNKPENGHPQDLEAVNVLIQDMRQPMSSIMGYTDLLLAESLGILGKGQRNFVERIRNSGDRLRNLIEDVVNLTASNREDIQTGHLPFEMNEIIDQAVGEISPQLFHRNIQLHIDLPDQLPGMHTDRDSLQQIIGYLLENAGSATPPEGSIGLRARLWHEENNEFIILQITDSGGGIAQDDLPRVFARHYGAEKATVPGTGDNGVGLALAKTLTLAMGGRIWVESVPGRTTTFTVLLPTKPSHSHHVPSQEIPAA
jgi:signal transduction histidine kinase